MPAYNFVKQFSMLVETGQKKQTIRRKRRYPRSTKVGDTLYLYYGMQTKHCRLLRAVTCTKIYEIEIGADDLFVWLNGKMLSHQEIDAFLLADGFKLLGLVPACFWHVVAF